MLFESLREHPVSLRNHFRDRFTVTGLAFVTVYGNSGLLMRIHLVGIFGSTLCANIVHIIEFRHRNSSFGKSITAVFPKNYLSSYLPAPIVAPRRLGPRLTGILQ